jgi:hypothetical protein
MKYILILSLAITMCYGGQDAQFLHSPYGDDGAATTVASAVLSGQDYAHPPQTPPQSLSFDDIFHIISPFTDDTYSGNTDPERIIFSLTPIAGVTTYCSLHKALILKYSSFIQGLYEADHVKNDQGQHILAEPLPLTEQALSFMDDINPESFRHFIRLLFDYDQDHDAFKRNPLSQDETHKIYSVLKIANILFNNPTNFFDALIERYAPSIFQETARYIATSSEKEDLLILPLPADVYDTARSFAPVEDIYVLYRELSIFPKLNSNSGNVLNNLKTYFTDTKLCLAWKALKTLPLSSDRKYQVLQDLSRQFIYFNDINPQHDISQTHIMISAEDLRQNKDAVHFFRENPNKILIVVCDQSTSIDERYLVNVSMVRNLMIVGEGIERLDDYLLSKLGAPLTAEGMNSLYMNLPNSPPLDVHLYFFSTSCSALSCSTLPLPTTDQIWRSFCGL